MATPTIFISYRREDSAGQSGRIFDRLVQQFGKDRVYRDVDTIAAGEDFVEAVREKINRSDILLALIGPRWLTAADEEGRWRLADENDLVRIEITTALDRNMRVIPVLLQDAVIPKAQDLPGELARLAQRNAIEIRDTNFDLDIEQLIAKLGSSWQNKFIGNLAWWLTRPLRIWISPQIESTPEIARIQIGQMGLQYDVDTFVKIAERGDIQAVELFLRAGMDSNAKNNEGNIYRQSAVMLAAANGHLDLVKLLQTKGANLDEAIPWAIRHEQKLILDFLLQNNLSQNAINLGLLAAADQSAIDIAKTFLDRGADVNFIDKDSGSSALMQATSSYSPNLELVQLLLSKGADVNLKATNGNTALFGAVRSGGNVELVSLLLAHGADVNISNSCNISPLHEAIFSVRRDEEEQQLEIVRILLDNGADLTALVKNQHPWRTPLSLAIDRAFPQAALLLIERGADPNDTTADDANKNFTVLMQAAEHGMTDVVKALLAKGAQINAPSNSGWSPLLSAASGRRGNEIIPILLDSGADPRITANNGNNVLMAANWGFYGSNSLDEEVFKRLIKSGMQINAVNKDGWTALMHAADSSPYENPDYVRQLLRFGADTTLKNNVGDTALAIATKKNYRETMHLLETHATNQRKSKRK